MNGLRGIFFSAKASSTDSIFIKHEDFLLNKKKEFKNLEKIIF
jgi:hypothetical protein